MFPSLVFAVVAVATCRCLAFSGCPSKPTQRTPRCANFVAFSKAWEESDDEYDRLQRRLSIVSRPPSFPWNQPEEETHLPWFLKFSSNTIQDGDDDDSGRVPFECTGCGKCCKTKGSVYMSPSEVLAASNLLGQSTDRFKQKYAAIENVRVELSTIPNAQTGDTGWVRLKSKADKNGSSCIFLDQETMMCRIYEARPLQCSTYPFWPQIMESRESWNNEVRDNDDFLYDNDTPQRVLWSEEGGGCEGMKRIEDDFAYNGNINGTTLKEVTEKLESYKAYKRRFHHHSQL